MITTPLGLRRIPIFKLFGKRGNQSTLITVMRTLLFAIILAITCENSVCAQERPYHQWSANLTHADVDFFFESITLEKGDCQFKLSANTAGMLWRIRTNKTDVTGACQTDQILSVPAAASLEIKRKDLNLYFLPLGPGTFNVRFILKPEAGISKETESREATILKVTSNGSYGIAIGED